MRAPTRVACAVTMLLTIVAFSGAATAQTRPRDVSATDLSGALESTARRVAPSIVQIFTTSFAPGSGVVPHASDLVTTQRASGSGVIVDAAGYIVTNAHVVRDAQRLRVEIPIPTQSGSILAGRSRNVYGSIIGVDRETDLAVIKVDEPNLTALPFGDSEELRAGEIVLAFGSPLGLYNSVSLGVVSSVARQLEIDSPMIYIQTDASINPGSSGGALVDLQGRLIGINTSIASQTGGNEGIGFSAPSNIVRTVYEQIRKVGHVRRGDIGIRTQTITPVLAAGLKLPREAGVLLADVLPGGPAAKAGLVPGDVVLTLDNKPMENARQLQVNLYRRLAGEGVTLEILRNGNTMRVPVLMSERNDPLGLGLASSIDPRQNLIARLGMLGIDLDARVADIIQTRRTKSGVVVVSTVEDATDSRDGGLAAGDVVIAINRTPVTRISELRSVVDALKIGDAVVVQLERRGSLMYLAFTVE